MGEVGIAGQVAGGVQLLVGAGSLREIVAGKLLVRLHWAAYLKQQIERHRHEVHVQAGEIAVALEDRVGEGAVGRCNVEEEGDLGHAGVASPPALNRGTLGHFPLRMRSSQSHPGSVTS